MRITSFILISLIVGLWACNKHKHTEEMANYKRSEKVILNKQLQQKVGQWLKNDMDCYGIILRRDEHGDTIDACPIKAHVEFINSDAIQMRACESKTFPSPQNCPKMGLREGNKWWERNGDLFKTEQEALNYCRQLLSSKTNAVSSLK